MDKYKLLVYDGSWTGIDQLYAGIRFGYHGWRFDTAAGLLATGQGQYNPVTGASVTPDWAGMRDSVT